MSIIDDLRDLIEHRAPEIEQQESVMAAVAADPLTQAAQASQNLPAGLRQDLADLIGRADAEFAAAVQQAAENGHAAGVASVQQPEAPPEPEGEPVPPEA